MSRYLLITSQRYYQRHRMVVRLSEITDDELLIKLRVMVEALETMKRKQPDNGKPFDEPYYYGDLDKPYWHGWKERFRYNINDRGGDVYIYCCSNEGDLAREYGSMALEEKNDCLRFSDSADAERMERIEGELYKYHRRGAVEAIVDKFFDRI